MDFELSPEQQLLRETTRRFLHEKAPVGQYVRARLAEGRGTTDAVWRGLAGLGLTGLLVDQRFGGAGLGFVEMGVVLQEMGRAVHPGPFLTSAAAVSAILQAGTADDWARWLPGLASGERVATFAHQEPHGQDPWAPRTTVARQAGGAWLLDGIKAYVPEVDAAQMAVVSASVDGQQVLFVVELDSSALDAVPQPAVDLTRRLYSVSMSGTPAHRLDGPAEATIAALDRFHLIQVSDGVGGAKAAVETAVAYALERIQFGRPIGSFQSVQHLLVDMLSTVELARSGAMYAWWAADSASSQEAHRAAVIASAFAADALPGVGANAIQVFGGIGYTWEHDIHLFYKRLLGMHQAIGRVAEQYEAVATVALAERGGASN
jgi:alkylation response protein AidB-like acyl-CoA dehydrogenase